MSIYPDPRKAFERTGCGDAFAATFISMLSIGRSPLEALVTAPVNAMSVAQFIGSHEGLLSLEQLDWMLGRAAEGYKPKEI
jgi:sugar/nucleoside kinase (ribokinase family)